MKYVIEIETDNAAFDIRPQDEVARILKELSERLERDVVSPPARLRDINGNTVGSVRITQ